MARTRRSYVSHRYAPPLHPVVPPPAGPVYTGNNYVYVLGSNVNPNTCKIGSGNPTDRCAAWNRDTRHVLRLYVAFAYEFESLEDAHTEEEKAQSVYEFANQNPNASAGGQEFFNVPPDQVDIYLSQVVDTYNEYKAVADEAAALAAERDALTATAIALTAERDGLAATCATKGDEVCGYIMLTAELTAERNRLHRQNINQKAHIDDIQIKLARSLHTSNEWKRAADHYVQDRERDSKRHEELRKKLELDNEVLRRDLGDARHEADLYGTACYRLAEKLDRTEVITSLRDHATEMFDFYKAAKSVTLRACDIHRFVGLTNEQLSEWGLPDSWHFSATAALLIGADYDNQTGCYMTPAFRDWLYLERNSDPSKENRASYFKTERTIVAKNAPAKPVVPVVECHSEAQSVLSRITASAARFFA